MEVINALKIEFVEELKIFKTLFNQPNELVQIETYLRQEGVLVRYWYPLSVLERPLHHQMSAASTCNVDVKDCVVHR